ncbi:Glycerol-3-phosphate dehydrogenase [Rhizoctonia solani]|uniref:Glycerol-3-phosphate dehydrogenase [NAD(+)] n=1 Tax=Rhizoctonia solani TaxID=456999 RepID=A0A8H7H7J0_9AGAM|nr:Glycerol-3-phosphate dehydrogenase [Rhizoctonia solani]
MLWGIARRRLLSSTTTFAFRCSMSTQIRKVEKEKVCVIGSGNWGSAIARIAAINTKKNPDVFAEDVTMYVYEEQGRSLSALINDTHENPKYLPGIQLGHNVVAEPDLLKSIKDATALVFVLPHQFLPPVLNAIRGHVSHLTRAVSLIKGVEVEGAKISTFPTVISSELGIPCSALSGANIANEGELFLDISLCTACFLARPHDLVAEDKFCESTLGVPPAPMTTPPDEDAQLHAFSESQLWHRLFQTNTFRIRVVQDVEGVCLCGGLKNVIALAAGFSDGLGWGSNSKAAIMRIGLLELKDFCLEFFPSTRASTFLEESCGVADIMTSCLSGRNRLIAEMMVKTGKGFRELEEEKLNGQKLQGPQTAQDLHAFLTARGDNVRRPGGYPLLEAVWRICYELAIRSLPRLHHVVTIYKKLLILAFDGFLSTTFLRTRRPTICTMAKEKVCLIGSGNWGSSIARIAAMNVKDHPDEEEITMFVHEEKVDGKPLSSIINNKHENVKYLPGIQLGSNVKAEPDLIKTIKGATALIVVVPHQFLEKVLDGVKEHLAPGARAVSLIKGVKADGGKIYTYPRIISSLLGIRCSTLGGANIAIGVAKDEFCESTLGVLPEGMKSHGEDSLSDADLWYKLFNRPTFRIRVVPDVDGVALCGGLKNVIALAAGFSDGLGWGSNTKSAIIRIGIMEIKDFCVHFFPEVKAETFLEESCGVADILTSCISGRNRKVAEDMVKTGKGFQQLEKEELGGQSLQGPQTAEQLHNFLEARSDEVRRSGGFPLIENVWKICYQGTPPEKLIEGL